MAKYLDEQDEQLEQLTQDQLQNQAAVQNENEMTEEQQSGNNPVSVRIAVWFKKRWQLMVKWWKVRQEAEKPEVEEHVPYTDLSDVDARIDAVRTMKDLQTVIDDYEKVISANKGMITNVKGMYASKVEYINRVSNINENVGHQALVEINTAVDKALINVIKNIYEMPLMQRYIETKLPKPVVEQPKPTMKPEKLKRNIWQVISHLATFCMAIITILAVWQCSSARNKWKAEGKIEGKTELAKVAQAKIDSLKHVIVNERSKRGGTAKRGNYYIDSKATVQSIFNSMDDVNRIKAENKRLRKRNQEINVAFSSLNADYETLRQKANSYAKAFEQEVGAKRTVAKKIVQVPKRSGSSGVFYTIQEKKNPNSHSLSDWE